MKEAIILAGGLGTRLRSIVPDLPKPMAPIGERPFLDLLLAFLTARGFRHVILSTGHMHQRIADHFGAARGPLSIDYCVEASPLGTGGAIRAALGRCRSDHALVLNGDTFLEADTDAIEALWAAHHEPVLVVRGVADGARYGRVSLQDERVVSFGEKSGGGPGLINAGCYLLPTTLLDGLDLPDRFSFETDYLPQAVQRQAFRAHVSLGYFIDIGVPDDYARAQTELAGRWP